MVERCSEVLPKGNPGSGIIGRKSNESMLRSRKRRPSLPIILIRGPIQLPILRRLPIGREAKQLHQDLRDEAESHAGENLVQSRQGDRSGHWRITCSAQEEDLSVWQDVQGFGILYFSVISGVMNRKVCARTNVFG